MDTAENVGADLIDKELKRFSIVHLPAVHKPNINKQNISKTIAISSTISNNNNNGDSIKKLNFGSAYAMHQSILDGRLKQVNYFLKLGINANSKDKFGRTSLMLACLCDFEEYGLQVAQLLLKHGANLNVRDMLGQSVLFIACTERREKFFNYLIDNYSSSIDFKLKDNDGNCLLNHVAVHGPNRMLKKVVKKKII